MKNRFVIFQFSENIRMNLTILWFTISILMPGFRGALVFAEPSSTFSVLDTHYRWATHITLLTPVVRNAQGKLEPLAENAFGRDIKVERFDSSPPPERWKDPDFDDSIWPRAPGPYPLLAKYAFGSAYHAHHLALFCMRGTFWVDTPSQAEGMKLSITYRGGVVIYLNGREIARAHMPEGAISYNTPAIDYPPEAFTDSQGNPVPADFECKRNKEHAERAVLRVRRMDNIVIPVTALRKGVNVLAIEIHRAPLSPAYSIRVRGRVGLWTQIAFLGLSLTAPQGVSVIPGGTPPKQSRLFNALPSISLHNLDSFDSWEPLKPIELIACRNASASGQVVLCSPGTIRGVTVGVSALERKTGGVVTSIPVSAIEIRYALPTLGVDNQELERFPDSKGNRRDLRRQLRRFDSLEELPPAEVSVPQGGETSLLPIWVTVNVPRGTTSGQYEGLLRVKADGMDETAVPIRLEVGDVTVPEFAKQSSYAGIVQSPDTLALKYGVKRWSEEHWELIERSFRQIGKIGGDCVVIPLVRRTFYGNEESMVRWVRGKDGSLRHDMKIMERYLDCAIKQSGPPKIICLCVWEPVNAYSDPGPQGKGMKMEVSVLDATTGEVGSMPAPEWGTPECVAFWKPVFDDIKRMIVTKGVERAMCVGTCAQASPGQVVLNDMETISPGIKWYALRHEWWDKVGQRETAVSIGVYGDPGRVGPGKQFAYSWQDPRLWAVWPRTSICAVRETSTPLFYRVFMNRVMIGGTSGIGNIGGDFWEIVPVGQGRFRSVVLGNWVQLTMGGWGTPAKLIAPGVKGPIGTIRLELLREGIQDAEIRVLIEKALTDEAIKTKLGTVWADKAKNMLQRYTHEILMAHPGGGKGFGGTFHDTFTWYAYILPAQRRALYEVASALERVSK